MLSCFSDCTLLGDWLLRVQYDVAWSLHGRLELIVITHAVFVSRVAISAHVHRTYHWLFIKGRALAIPSSIRAVGASSNTAVATSTGDGNE